jgi:hypothetical protein
MFNSILGMRSIAAAPHALAAKAALALLREGGADPEFGRRGCRRLIGNGVPASFIFHLPVGEDRGEGDQPADQFTKPL